MIDLVVFDMAGTTLEDGDAVNVAFRGALAAADIPADPEVVRTVMGLRKPDAIRFLIREAGQERNDDEVETIHRDFVKRMIHYYETDPAVREIPGTRDVFRLLQSRGIKIGLDTGFSRDIVTVILNRLGWSVPETIDVVVCSDEVEEGRPYPFMIQKMMAELGITDPNRIAKVGDTQADLEEGANAKCRLIIGVTSGSYTRAQLMPYPHTHIVETVLEVPAILGLS